MSKDESKNTEIVVSASTIRCDSTPQSLSRNPKTENTGDFGLPFSCVGVLHFALSPLYNTIYKTQKGGFLIDWKKIKAEYVAGGTSYRKLAQKYGVPRTNLERRAKEEKWTELRRQAECKTEAKIINAVSEKNAKIDDKYYRLVDKLFSKAEEVIDNTPIWQVNSIKEMATALKYLKECKGVKSDIDLREQEARIAKLQKEVEVEESNNDIKVVIGSEAEDYSE